MFMSCLLAFVLCSVSALSWKIPQFNNDREFEKMYQNQHERIANPNPTLPQETGDRVEGYLSEGSPESQFARPMRESRANPTVPPQVIRVLRKWLLSISQQTNRRPLNQPGNKWRKLPTERKWKVPSDEITKKPHTNKVYEMRAKFTTLSPEKQIEKRRNQTKDFIIHEKEYGNGVQGEESEPYVAYRLSKRSVEKVDLDELYDAVKDLSNNDLKMALSRIDKYSKRLYQEMHEEKCCFNGGTCIKRDGETWCACPPQFTGRICFDDVNECSNNASVCPPHSHCRNDYGSHTCVCNQRFVKEGKDCIPQTTCAENPCKNGALCVDNEHDGSFTCMCKLGFSGDRCEQVLRECDDSPCGKNEICISTPKGFECRSNL